MAITLSHTHSHSHFLDSFLSHTFSTHFISYARPTDTPPQHTFRYFHQAMIERQRTQQQRLQQQESYMPEGGNSMGYGSGMGGGNGMGYNSMMGDAGGGMMGGMGGGDNDCHVYQIAYGKLALPSLVQSCIQSNPNSTLDS